jgi:hypothetical protein
VRGLQVAQPAVLHVRDVATGELELEQVGVVRGAHQHRLLADLAGLRGLVEAEDELGRDAARALGAPALRPQPPRIRPLRLIGQGVGHI